MDHDGFRHEGLRLLRRVVEDAVLLQKGVLFLAEQQPPLMEKGDVVAELFQIAENVGGDQDGVGLVPGELVEKLQDLVPDDGVQAGGGLVQHQQLVPDGSGRRRW